MDNNCGCTDTTVAYNKCNNCAPQESCDCIVKDLGAQCVLYTDDDITCDSVTVITKNINLSDNLKNLVSWACQKFSEVQNYFKVTNVGAGSEIYAGDNLLGEKKIRTLIAGDNITITQETDTITISAADDSTNQNNFVRQLNIDILDLGEGYSKSDVISYILALPAEERTIAEIDSKWNIIVSNFDTGDILEVYELQNTGKGVISSIGIDDLLSLGKPGGQNLQETLEKGNTSSLKVLLNGGTFNPHLDLELGANGGLYLTDSLSELSTRVDSAGISSFDDNTGQYASLNFQGVHFDNNLLRGSTLSTGTGEMVLPKTTNLQVRTILAQGDVKVNAGTNVTVTGDGSEATPFVINSTASSSDTALKKIINSDYTLSNADHNYTLFVDNELVDITITIPSGLRADFNCGGYQQGTGEVVFAGTGVTVNSPLGYLKVKGQHFNFFVDKAPSPQVETYQVSGTLKA